MEEESAYLVEIFAGLLYVMVGLPLLRLARRARDAAARLIGATFVLWGFSYLLFNFALALERTVPITPFFFAGRVAYDLGVLSIAIFTLRVFRNGEIWARGLVAASFVCIAGGVAGSALVGDWEGVYPLSNPWFWVEWTGMSLPFAWVAVEGLLEYAQARRRAALGLCAPLVFNRYLLWGLVGLLLISSNVAMIPQYIEYERDAQFSGTMDALLGGCEFLTIGIIWLAFFPPAWYRRWIESGSKPASAPSAG